MTQSLPETGPSGDVPQRTNESLFDEKKSDDGSSAEGAPPRNYTLRAKLLLALCSLAATLLLCEITYRALGLAPRLRLINLHDVDSPYIRSHNPLLGYEHKVSYRNEHADSIISFSSTNSHGQRDIERTLKKPSGVRRILLLGDSVVESLEVRRLDDLMNRQLEMLYTDGKTEVLNFGVNGYCTLAEVELLRTKGVKFKPDLVVLVFVDNDYFNFNAAEGGTAAALDEMQEAVNLRSNSPTYKFLIRHSHLFRATFGPRRKDNDMVSLNREALGDNNVLQGLKLLRELADEHSFDVVIAIWPRFLDHGIVHNNRIRGSNKLVIEVLAALYRFPTVRLSKHFQEHWRSRELSGSPRSYYTIGDEMHVNEAGSRAAAHVLKIVVDDFPKLNSDVAASADTSQLAAVAIAAAREMGSEYKYDIATAVVELGFAQEQQNRLEEALNYYQLALEIDPSSKAAHTRLQQVRKRLRLQQVRKRLRR